MFSLCYIVELCYIFFEIFLEQKTNIETKIIASSNKFYALTRHQH